MSDARHVDQIFVKAEPEVVWQAIVDPAFTRHYFRRTALDATLEQGTSCRSVLPDGTDAVLGDVEVIDPPRRLVMTWR
jgi:uncharacterized protein YndB with AHSA1/START domain